MGEKKNVNTDSTERRESQRERGEREREGERDGLVRQLKHGKVIHVIA